MNIFAGAKRKIRIGERYKVCLDGFEKGNIIKIVSKVDDCFVYKTIDGENPPSTPLVFTESSTFAKGLVPVPRKEQTELLKRKMLSKFLHGRG